jgi:hypothetical protein
MIVTGIHLWREPALLIALVVHVCGFWPGSPPSPCTCSLALINPATRPRAARDHPRRRRPRVGRAPPRALARLGRARDRTPQGSAALLVAVVLARAARRALLRLGARFDAAPVAKPEADSSPGDGVVDAVDRFIGGVLDPGPLSKAHESLTRVGDCVDCHGTASQVIDARCVACHEEIGARAEKRVGWHGTFDEPCRTCHTEHAGADAELIEFDRDAFQHDLARFELRGAPRSRL